MSDDDNVHTHPTPPSGTPVQRPTTFSTRPTIKQEEISAPRSSDSAILQTLYRIEDKFDRKFEEQTATNQELRSAYRTIANEVSELKAGHTEMHKALVDTSAAAATAAKMALDALKINSSAQDETQKMVESAMRIQKGAISAEVKSALGPIEVELESLKTAGAERTVEVKKIVDTQASIVEAQSAIVNELGIEDQVKLGRTVGPNEKLPPPTLRRMDRNAKWAAASAAATTGGLLIKLLIDLLASSHH